MFRHRFPGRVDPRGSLGPRARQGSSASGKHTCIHGLTGQAARQRPHGHGAFSADAPRGTQPCGR
eukprot:2076220-Pyramimonas_sp.AAC.1